MKALNKLKDPVSGLTHFIGFLLAIAGLYFLIRQGSKTHSARILVSFVIYGTSLILLYGSSTLYHWLPLGKAGGQKLRKLDHIMIFFLIAGTYTPISLISLGGFWGWTMFGLVWTIALGGTVTKLFYINAPRKLYVSIYLAMGWIVVLFAYPVSQMLSAKAITFLFAGGMGYTVGAVLYYLKKPDPFPGIFGFHEIWHLFVMTGSFFHWWMIYNYVN
ncbi:MAG: hemolysin III family protein [Deltaproteobacteria bacterium]|jgi:hemolysin III|nr:hemolysin III family protein [Deltaproteobacteria bacterium]